MSLTNEQIIEAIASKSVSEIVELIAAMEEKFGVSAAAAVAAAPAAAPTVEEVAKEGKVIRSLTRKHFAITEVKRGPETKIEG
ncbi:MAG: 50S ribosomal protein L7/L12, partial [Actinobacillus porcinus]|nr:50S ribosomal protein L7/L12 [Actinobacillus porcinus]